MTYCKFMVADVENVDLMALIFGIFPPFISVQFYF